MDTQALNDNMMAIKDFFVNAYRCDSTAPEPEVELIVVPHSAGYFLKARINGEHRQGSGALTRRCREYVDQMGFHLTKIYEDETDV